MRKLKITELNRLTVSEYKLQTKRPIIVVLDNVRSLHNVGSAFRTCDAFNISELWLCGITSTPPSAEIHKTAIGAEFSVDWRYFDDTMRAVEELKKAGYEIIAVEQVENSVLLNNFKVEDKKYALIFGNEVKGVSQNVVDQCDFSIEIPQFGTKHSLNVSVSVGIALWALVSETL